MVYCWVRVRVRVRVRVKLRVAVRIRVNIRVRARLFKNVTMLNDVRSVTGWQEGKKKRN